VIKRDERSSAQSCWNKADEDEMLFVLMARDPAAPFAIRAWIAERLRIGRNRPDDQKIKNAQACLRTMEMRQREGRT
jgi:hypothetical protein